MRKKGKARAGVMVPGVAERLVARCNRFALASMTSTRVCDAAL